MTSGEAGEVQMRHGRDIALGPRYGMQAVNPCLLKLGDRLLDWGSSIRIRRFQL